MPDSRLVDVTVTANGPEAASTLAKRLAAPGHQPRVGRSIQQFEDDREVAGRSAGRAAPKGGRERGRRSSNTRNGKTPSRSKTGRTSSCSGCRICNSAVTRAKTERIAKEELYNRLQELQQQPGDADTFPAILGSSYIQALKSGLSELIAERAQLSQQYGDLHPEMTRINGDHRVAQQRLDSEVSKLAGSVRNEYLAALAQERSLSAALESQKVRP